MIASRVLFLNVPQIGTGRLEGAPLRRDYVLACRFLRCSIIDRTATLDAGFPTRVLDPIPAPGGEATFAELCDAIGCEMVRDAIREDRDIRVFWSGGIDSTTALIAILKAATALGYRHRLRVLLSLDSVHEYPRFFLDTIDGHLRIEAIRQSASAHLDPLACNVTGEHGDQLFGSHLLRSYVQRRLAGADYREMLPFVLLECLRNPLSVRRVQRFLQPVIDAAPVPIVTLFDAMWWLNFALKWQEVSLRLCAAVGGDAHPRYRATRHFFRDERFQSWAMAVSSEDRCPAAWERYKDVAKAYIRDFTSDDDYFRDKEKEDSLRNIMPRAPTGDPVAIVMREDFRPVSRVLEPDTSTRIPWLPSMRR